jgi:hypothetical protein
LEDGVFALGLSFEVGVAQGNCADRGESGRAFAGEEQASVDAARPVRGSVVEPGSPPGKPAAANR